MNGPICKVYEKHAESIQFKLENDGDGITLCIVNSDGDTIETVLTIDKDGLHLEWIGSYHGIAVDDKGRPKIILE